VRSSTPPAITPPSVTPHRLPSGSINGRNAVPVSLERSTGLLPRSTTPALIAISLIALGTSIVFGVAIGSVPIAPATVWEIIVHELTGRGETGAALNLRQIVWDLRLPRVLLAGLVGAGLAVSGVTIQALVRNPIADPYVLGVSSGASVGAALVLVFGVGSGLGGAALSVTAFATAMGSMLIVYAVAQRNGHIDPLRLILSGVVVGTMFAALTSFLVFSGDPRAAQQVLFWLLGSFGRARWSNLLIPAVVLFLALAAIGRRARELDALLTGDDAATSLGVAVGRLRIELFVITAALTAVMVAVSGAVGFVGLIVPHVARLLVGSRHRPLLPVAALLGAVFMIWVDVAARTLASPQEIPVGILTAMTGGPVFLALSWYRDRSSGVLR
jgi:iron complex transport system permease protein